MVHCADVRHLLAATVTQTAPNFRTSHYAVGANARVALVLPRRVVLQRVSLPAAASWQRQIRNIIHWKIPKISVNKSFSGQRKLTVALFSAASRRTDALKISDSVHTGASVQAGIRGAFVDVYSTIGTGEAVGALAQEPVDAVDAFGAVVARLGNTVVDVILAVVSFETIPTYALVIIACIHAGASVQARIGSARGSFWKMTCCS